MDHKESLSKAEEIMAQFALLTGVSGEGKVPPERYLWTDAFALCNFLGLYRLRNDAKYRRLAMDLANQVHRTLGRHRGDDPRTGWISGLGEEEGELHPTRGGLRIGKEMNERRPEEPFDEPLEWDRDGQYYHYLTKWMHGLNCLSRITGEFLYNRWAVELAKRAHAGFTYGPLRGAPKRMYWKMSIDLSYPLVRSMGQHDPLDGLITYSQLEETLSRDPDDFGQQGLLSEITDMAQICKGKDWATDDPLGIGGLLSDGYRAAQLIVNGGFERIDLLAGILNSSLGGLRFYRRKNPLKLPAEYRLAFRELGLSIGLKAVQRLKGLIRRNPKIFHGVDSLDVLVDGLMEYLPLGEMIEMFWLDPRNSGTDIFREHRNINMVMLATSLASDGYLVLD